MLGDLIGEEKGKITGQRVLDVEGGIPKLETSFSAAGKYKGVEAIDTGTYWSTPRAGGVIYGEGQGVLMSKDGQEIATWTGQGIGRFIGPGKIRFTGSGFFAMGLIPVDTLDSVVLRSVFSRMFNTKGFTYLSYALSGVALTIAAFESYAVITNVNIVPPLTGPVLAIIIITGAFGYGFVTLKKRVLDQSIPPRAHNHNENSN